MEAPQAGHTRESPWHECAGPLAAISQGPERGLHAGGDWAGRRTEGQVARGREVEGGRRFPATQRALASPCVR